VMAGEICAFPNDGVRSARKSNKLNAGNILRKRGMG